MFAVVKENKESSEKSVPEKSRDDVNQERGGFLRGLVIPDPLPSVNADLGAREGQTGAQIAEARDRGNTNQNKRRPAE